MQMVAGMKISRVKVAGSDLEGRIDDESSAPTERHGAERSALPPAKSKSTQLSPSMKPPRTGTYGII